MNPFADENPLYCTQFYFSLWLSLCGYDIYIYIYIYISSLSENGNKKGKKRMIIELINKMVIIIIDFI